MAYNTNNFEVAKLELVEQLFNSIDEGKFNKRDMPEYGTEAYALERAEAIARLFNKLPSIQR